MKKMIFLLWVLTPHNGKNTIVFADRITESGDNGEVLFKYFFKKKYDKGEFYYLGKSECGTLLNSGSLRQWITLFDSKILVSSHLLRKSEIWPTYHSPAIHNLIQRRSKYKLLFVPHGIIRCDMSHYFNNYDIDYIVASTKYELENFKSFNYQFNQEQVLKFGLPRFDLLEAKEGNRILLFSSWRQYLTSDNFSESRFLAAWLELLTEEKLQSYLSAEKKKITWILHPRLYEFEHILKRKMPVEFVEIVRLENINVSEWLRSCSLMITDISSISFDVSFMRKQVVYYNFKEEDVHITNQDKTYELEKDMGFVFESCEDIVEFIIGMEPKNGGESPFLEVRNSREKHYDFIVKMVHGN